MTVQIERIEALTHGDPRAVDAVPPIGALPTVPGRFEEWRVVRQIHATSRSHVYFALDPSGTAAALKFPSHDLANDAAYLLRLATEEWTARRIASPHVLAARAAQPLLFWQLVSLLIAATVVALLAQ